MKLIKKVSQMFLLIITNLCFSQNNANNILSSVWELDKSLLYKEMGAQRFILSDKNQVYYIDFYSNGNDFESQIHKNKYFFLSDSIFNVLSVKELNDKELASFFNEKKHKTLLLENSVLDFSKEDRMLYLVYLSMENENYTDAHLYSYQFYNKNTFNQYGYGWTPGQPQIGYVYNLAKNVPREVMFEIQKINPDRYKTLKIKQSKIFNDKKIVTKMYLLKGDIVEIIEEKGEWLKIRYYGKRMVEGWIKKSDVNNP